MARKTYTASWDTFSKTWALVESTEERVVSTGHTRTEALNLSFSLNLVEEKDV